MTHLPAAMVGEAESLAVRSAVNPHPHPNPSSSESNKDTDSVTWASFHSDHTLSRAFCLWCWGLHSSQSLGQAIVCCTCVALKALLINFWPPQFISEAPLNTTARPDGVSKIKPSKRDKQWSWVDPGLCHLSCCSTNPTSHPLSRGKPHSCFRSHFFYDKPISHLNSL